MELNEQQREAVKYTVGPLLVVAGAGTGKTTVLIERVLRLLERDDGNILALTFTRKAAEVMRQRAFKKMRRGAAEKFEEHARRCHFSTFHSFCYDLLRENKDKDRPWRALDPIDQWIYFRRHLEDLELDYYLKISEPGRFLHDLVDFCSRCHDNLVRPQDYREYVENAAAGYDQRVREGKPLPEDSEQEIARLRELARIYERSEALQEQEGFLSFGAMISQAVFRLQNSPELLHRLRQRYRHILVDEFQDTNAAQLELVSLLAGERKNVTVVGDEYQAIYRFRGASYGSFELFQQRFPKYKKIVLHENYRSTQSILDVAEALARKLDRYDPKKKLTPIQAEGREVEVLEFADDEQQAEWVAAEIARMVKSGEAEKYADVAVLYRKHNLREPLVAALRRRDIPMAIRGRAVNKMLPVRDLVAHLRAIGQPEDNVSLLRVLANPQWGADVPRLVPYCRTARKRRTSLRAVIEEDDASEWPGRSRLLALLGRYRQIAEQERLGAWLDALRRESGLGSESAAEPALRAFSEFVQQWDQEKCSTGLLEEFLEYFAYFEEAGGVVALPEEGGETAASAAPLLHAREGAAAEQLPLLEEAAKEAALGRVQLMTVHAAKGLEFQHVFLFHLAQRAFPVPNRQPLISLPADLWKGPLLKGDYHLEEERRLFYVGLTRAKRRLTLCTIRNESGRKKPSRFLEELREADCPALVWKQMLSPETPQPRPQRPEVSSAEGTGSHIAAWVTETASSPPAETFSLSASGLETYLRCPLQYHLSYGWQIPQRPSPALLFGTLMHEAVKEIVRAAAARQGMDRERLEAILDGLWPASGFPDPLQERRYRERGLEQLEKVRQAWTAEPFDLLYQEQPFQFSWAGTRLVGRIDQANRIGPGEVELIEYKTGRPQTQKETDGSLQLTVYAEACQQGFGLRPRRLVLFNLTTGEKLETTRTPQESAALEKKIRQVRSDILAGKFPAQPGYHCRYCDFQSLCPAQQDLVPSPGPFSPVGRPRKMGL